MSPSSGARSLAACALFFFSACHAPQPQEDAGVPITGTVSGSGVTAQTTIDADGGVLSAEGMTLTLGAGALPDGTEIKVTPLEVPGGENVITPMYRFEPEGLEFAVPVTVRFEFPNGVPEKAEVVWTTKEDPGQAEALDSWVEGNALVAEVTHFSIGYVRMTQDCGNGTIEHKSELHCIAPCANNSGSCCKYVRYIWSERCDDGAGNVPRGTRCPRGQSSCGTACSTTCLLFRKLSNVCGDRVVQTNEGEACDDGNTLDDICAPLTTCNACGSNCGQRIVTPAALEWTQPPPAAIVGRPFPLSALRARASNGAATTARVTVELEGADAGAPVSHELGLDGGAFSDFQLDSPAAGVRLVARFGSIIARTPPFDVEGPHASSLAFEPLPTSWTAGDAQMLTVRLLDQTGLPFTEAPVTVQLTSPTAPANGALTMQAMSSNGVAVLSVRPTVAGSYVLSVSAPGVPSLSTPAFSVVPAPMTTLQLQGPATGVAGAAFAIQVTGRDDFGNASGAGTVSVTTSLGTTLPSVNLVASTGSTMATVTRAGSITLTASLGALSANHTVVIGPAAPVAIAFAQQPTDVEAGAVLTPAPAVRVEDSFGNPTGTSGWDVTIRIGIDPLMTRTTVGGLAVFDGLSFSRAGNYTLFASAPPANTAQLTPASQSFVVRPAPATVLAVTNSPGTATAGQPFSLVVSLRDAYGNLTSNAAISAALVANAFGGVLGGTATRTTLNSLVNFDDLTINRPGTYQVEFTSTGGLVARSTAFLIVAGPPARLAFVDQPQNTPAGAALPDVTVRVTDSQQNPLATDGLTVSLALATNPGGSTLSGTTTQSTVSGLATFPGLRLNVPSGGYTLSATSGSLTAGTSSSFAVTAPVATSLAFLDAAPSTTAGTTIAPLRVEVRDGTGARIGVSANVTLTLSNNPTSDTLLGTLTQAAVNGIATFSDLSLRKASSTYVFAASSAGLTGAALPNVSITPAAAASLAVTTQPAQSEQHLAVSGAPSVAIVDAFGNRTNDAVPVTASLQSSSTGATLDGTIAPTTSAGVATFDDLRVTRPCTDCVLQFSSPGLTSVSSSVFEVRALVPSFSVSPSGVAVNQGFSATVELRTAAGALASVATSLALGIADNPGGATLGGTTTLSTTSGSATFTSLTLDRSGVGYRLRVSAPGMSDGFSSTFNVASSAQALRFTRLPAVTPDEANFIVEVAAVDGAGNVDTSFTGAVTLAKGADPTGAATLSGTLTVNAVNGRALFRTPSLDRTGTGFTLVASSTGLPNLTSAPFAVGLPPANDGLGQLDPVTLQFDGTPTRSESAYGFNLPAGIALDTVRHRLFIADTNNFRVLVFNLSAMDDFTGVDRVADFVLGQPSMRHFQSRAPQSSQTMRPSGLAIDPTRGLLFVSDTQSASGRIMIFDVTSVMTDEPAAWILGPAAATSSLRFITTGNWLAGLAYDVAGQRLFVADTQNNRVVAYDVSTVVNGANANLVLGQATFSTVAAATTQTGLSSPTGVAIDATSNRLYVADTGNHRVIGYSLTGVANGAAAAIVLGQSSFTTRTTGNSATAMNNPVGVATGQGQLFVSELQNARVTSFTLNGLATGGAATSVLGRSNFGVNVSQDNIGGARTLTQPNGGLALLGSRLWVSDGVTSARVLVFDVATTASGEAALDGAGHPDWVNPGLDFTRSGENDGYGPQYVGGARAMVLDEQRHWLFVADTMGQMVRGFRLSANNDFAGVDRVADLELGRSTLDAPGGSTLLNVHALAFDSPGNMLYVASDTSVFGFDLSLPFNGMSPTRTIYGCNPIVTGYQCRPISLAYDNAGRLLFVGDDSHLRTLVFDENALATGGPAIAVIGQPSMTAVSGLPPSQVISGRPQALTWDEASSSLYVATNAGSRILRYPLATLQSAPSADLVLGQPNFTSTTGGLPSRTQFTVYSQTEYLAIDASRRLYFSDSYNRRVLVFDVSTPVNGAPAASRLGQLTWTSTADTFDPSGLGACALDGLSSPTGLAVTSSGRLFVADETCHRVGTYQMP